MFWRQQSVGGAGDSILRLSGFSKLFSTLGHKADIASRGANQAVKLKPSKAFSADVKMHQASPVDETILHSLDETTLVMGALRTDFIEEILSGEVLEVQTSEQAMKGGLNVADVMAELEKERRKNVELLGRVSSLEAKLGCEDSNSGPILEYMDEEVCEV